MEGDVTQGAWMAPLQPGDDVSGDRTCPCVPTFSTVPRAFLKLPSCYSPSMAWPHRWHAHSGLLTTPSFQHSHTMSPPSVGPTPMMGSLPASCHTRVQPLTGKDGSSGSHGKQRWGGPGQVGTWSLRSGLARGGPLTTVFN